MDLEEALRCLAEADAGPGDGRYAAISYSPDGTLSGETTSIHAAFDLVAEHLITFAGGEDPAELVARLADFDDGLVDRLRVMGIPSPARQLVAAVLMDAAGPMRIVTDEHWRDYYLGEGPLAYPGARFVLLASAEPPNQEFATGILELQPTGRSNGPTTAVNELDERGMSPLHVAVAHLDRPAVLALLAAGADVGLQAEFGNAPQFAALESGEVGPYAARIDDGVHMEIIKALIDAGADVNFANRSGATLLDLAVATVPYPTEIVDFLLSHGARSGHLRGRQLPELTRSLPYPDPGDLQFRLNQIRLLLRTGVDPNAPLDGETALGALFLWGYHERDVPGEYVLALVDLLVTHGASAALPDKDGRTVLDRAVMWFEHGLTHYGPIVDRLRAGQTSEA
jgi:ankyrin repeat protein